MKCNIPANRGIHVKTSDTLISLQVEAYTLKQAIHLKKKKKLQRHLETLTPTLHLELIMDKPSDIFR